MGFLLRENSILLKCYPTIKVFCGLAVKQRGPEVEITGFSFWLCHKFPLAWALGKFLHHCVCHLGCAIAGVPGGRLDLPPGETPVTPLTWRNCVSNLTCVLRLCRRWWESLWCQNLLVQTPREAFLLCPTSGVCVVWESLSRGMSWAVPCPVPCPALGTADGANAAWDFPEL